MFPLLFLLLLLERKYRVHVSGLSYHDLYQLTKKREARRVSTLDGLLALLSTHSPAIILLETSEDLRVESSKNCVPLISELVELGYIAEARKGVSLQFGVCQRRQRDYVIGYKIVRGKPRQYTEDALKRGSDFPEPPFP